MPMTPEQTATYQRMMRAACETMTQAAEVLGDESIPLDVRTQRFESLIREQTRLKNLGLEYARTILGGSLNATSA